MFLPVYPHTNVGLPILPVVTLPGPLAISPLHPSSLSPPLLLVWMNISSLTPWLLDFHTVRFSGSSGYFFVFKFVVFLLLVVQGGKVYLPCLLYTSDAADDC